MRWGLAIALLLIPTVVAQGNLLASPHTTLCFLDIAGDGRRSNEDPVYLQVTACGAGPQAGDVRLTSVAGLQGGTIVHGLDADAGGTGAAVAGTYAYFDNDGNGVYNLADDLFLAFGSVPGPLAASDIPLSGPDAFTPVAGSDGRIGRPIQTAPVAVSGESYRDYDGQPGYSTGDIVYLDLDASGGTSYGDLRLALGTTAQPASTSTTSTSAPHNPSSASEVSHETNPPTTNTPGPQPPSEGKGTPSVSVPLLVLLALAGATMRRRKRDL